MLRKDWTSVATKESIEYLYLREGLDFTVKRPGLTLCFFC